MSTTRFWDREARDVELELLMNTGSIAIRIGSTTAVIHGVSSYTRDEGSRFKRYAALRHLAPGTVAVLKTIGANLCVVIVCGDGSRVRLDSVVVAGSEYDGSNSVTAALGLTEGRTGTARGNADNTVFTFDLQPE